ncbi:DMT family transporter [Bosea lathyri]|uniref:Permease of the drug/metabolite transporter (DMT) superfamily n=1 Tax=Bosea lathyri TaxID=1036778 RepID=A0A1H6BTU4_9HYPH|nr:DMT family transporter [Bosea lathyri]SEG64151.1 Permease of the drug/metabolite transporter (DMT) superfamily [Bosea lathyri]
MASAAENRRGILSMLLAMSLFTGNDLLMKLAREVYPAGQAIALRTIFAILAGLALVFAFRESDKLLLALRPVVLLRGLIEATVALSFVWALGMLPLANATAIGMASPLLIVALAVALRIERIGWRRTLAVLVGFCGVLIVLRPSADGFNAAALIALASAVLVAFRDLLTRSIGNDVPSTVISLTTTVLVGIVAVSYGSLEDWQPIWRRETAFVAAAAVLVSSGSFFIIGAFRNTDVGIVSGYRYSVIIFAVIAGYLIWGDIPEPLAFVGIGLIVASGLYTMHRQRVRPDSNLKLTADPTP